MQDWPLHLLLQVKIECPGCRHSPKAIPVEPRSSYPCALCGAGRATCDVCPLLITGGHCRSAAGAPYANTQHPLCGCGLFGVRRTTSAQGTGVIWLGLVEC